jgi:TetR/AcrR family transcriptional regulator
MARPTRQVGSRSAVTRERILEAALEAFGARGFAGASMHEIARRAGVHTPQLSYHFSNKRGLWEAAVTSLLEELDRRVAEAAGSGNPEDALRGLIRVFVLFAAEHPELNRIIVAESAESSERLDWLVENHTRQRYRAFTTLVEPLQRRGIVHPIPATSLYYLLVGGASLPFSAAPEAELFSGQDPRDPVFIEAHAAALETMLFTH